jgi:hypothetical protein
MRPRLLLLALLGFALTGCWEVLTHQESETEWMAWDGVVAVTPPTLQIVTTAGELATAELSLAETSGKAGIEMELAVEGTGAEHVTLTPGEFTVGLTPSGSLTVQVQFQAPATAAEYELELVITTTGAPAEIRVPLLLIST